MIDKKKWSASIAFGFVIGTMVLLAAGVTMTALAGGVYTACCYRPEGSDPLGQIIGGSLLAFSGFISLGFAIAYFPKWFPKDQA